MKNSECAYDNTRQKISIVNIFNVRQCLVRFLGIWLMLLFCIALPTFLGAANLSWQVFYENGQWASDTDDSWVGDNTHSERTDEGLLVRDPSEIEGSGRLYMLKWGAVPNNFAAIEAQVRVISSSGSVGLVVADGVHEESLYIFLDRLELVHAKVVIPFNSRGAAHTYRLEIKGNDVMLLVDGKLLYDGKGKFLQPASSKRNICGFGSGSSAATGEAVWKWVKYQSDQPVEKVKPTAKEFLTPDGGLVAVEVCDVVVLNGKTAEMSIFDFETEADVAAWKLRNPATDTLTFSSRFATSGNASMQFTTPPWEKGMEQWPAFEAKPLRKDWSDYDRLLVDVTNRDKNTVYMWALISDSQVNFLKGFNPRFYTPPMAFKRFVIPLDTRDFPKNINRGDISFFQFFTQRPVNGMNIHLDNVMLLRKGESVPALSRAFIKQLVGMFLEDFGSFQKLVDQCRNEILPLCDTPALLLAGNAEITRIQARVDEISAELESPTLTIDHLTEVQNELIELPPTSKRMISAMRLQQSFDQLGFDSSPMVVGFATSMEKLLPREMPVTARAAGQWKLEMARNERESFQMAVMPRKQALSQVHVSVTPLTSASGAVFPAENINCDVMGYVQTKIRPTGYPVSYLGWWPDPILDFLGPVDIAVGDLQSFWIRLRASKSQAPGLYKGQISVAAAGVEPLTFDLSVKVHSFALPDHSPLPTAITFGGWPEEMGGKKNWPKMKLKYADFLADYGIDYDNLYRPGGPDFEVLERQHRQGRLVAFNLGCIFKNGLKDENVDQAIADSIKRLRPAYQKAEELGLLDHAYIYGFDECTEEQFPLLERASLAVHEAFPKVPLISSALDDSYGMKSAAKSIDTWVPKTSKFDLEKVAQARAGGTKVWWYICMAPINPYANWFVEYSAIEARLLMGAMTTKYRPDGFLYYLVNMWNNRKSIENGPFTNWSPVSYMSYHGDGSLICWGDGGKPVPTIRLENFSDGLDDYAYACLLEEAIRRSKARKDPTIAQKSWLEEAEAALVVPETLVRDLKEYSRDPMALYVYRNRMAELIDQSGFTDLDPWGPNFGVRGFPAR
jgi:hypothetical protein